MQSLYFVPAWIFCSRRRVRLIVWLHQLKSQIFPSRAAFLRQFFLARAKNDAICSTIMLILFRSKMLAACRSHSAHGNLNFYGLLLPLLDVLQCALLDEFKLALQGKLFLLLLLPFPKTTVLRSTDKKSSRSSESLTQSQSWSIFISARASLIIPDGFENTFPSNLRNHWSWIHAQSHRNWWLSVSINERNISGKTRANESKY